jgi:hypothetical protein
MKSGKYMSYLLVLPLLFGGVHSYGADEIAVLCVGIDGHILVEMGGESGECSDTHPGETTPAAETMLTSDASEESHCGTCVDIPLVLGGGSHATYTSQRSTKVPPNAATAATLGPAGAGNGCRPCPVTSCATRRPDAQDSILSVRLLV